jgi:putative (di)nucleoside polyphosphate hydrolase
MAIFLGCERAPRQHIRLNMPRYRPNVAAILIREDSRILVCERSGTKGSWQFPQGGIDKGESPKQALFREVREEVGVKKKKLTILAKKSGYRYTFPAGKVKWEKFRGQKQVYFLCQFHGLDTDINLGKGNAEFQSYRWISPEQFDLAWLPRFKRKVYRKVMRDFFEIDLRQDKAE